MATKENPYQPPNESEFKNGLDANRLDRPPAATSDWLALGFTMLIPTVVTFVYFQWLKDSDSSFQQTAYGIGKAIQFGFPIAWVLIWYRHKLNRSGDADTKQIWIGIGFGLLVVATMFAIYFLLIQPSEVAAGLTELVKEKVSGLGVDSIWKYFGLGCFYALGHSFLEEYYWRWFVFDYLKKFTSTWMANILSSLGFMAHHVILLAFFFGWGSPLTYLFSLCIAVGGMFWAWQYHRTGRLIAPWISHMIVDAGIFGLGYFLIRDIL